MGNNENNHIVIQILMRLKLILNYSSLLRSGSSTNMYLIALKRKLPNKKSLIKLQKRSLTQQMQIPILLVEQLLVKIVVHHLLVVALVILTETAPPVVEVQTASQKRRKRKKRKQVLATVPMMIPTLIQKIP